MDPAVALVQAYLQLNGYLTIAEFPIAGGGLEGSLFAEHHAALHGVRLTQPALASMYLLDKLGVLGAMTSSPPTGGRQV